VDRIGAIQAFYERSVQLLAELAEQLAGDHLVDSFSGGGLTSA
jgi:hypothetical protein